ncbi:MAG: sulfite exporter TauE/SafE family protein [Kangiellaceae bacterium]|nr:sulfite exporter TauE/SafE family protein [Kangiellaceae bacterium]
MLDFFLNSWLLFLAVGALAGLLAGLLGIGGGFVIVPALMIVLPTKGFSPEHFMHVALGTSLATITVTSLSSMWSHHKRGGVDWRYFVTLAPGVLIGALLSGVIADAIPAKPLAILFGSLALLMMVQLFRSNPNQGAANEMKTWQVVITSGGIGCLSGLTGIGGGSIVAPYLHFLGERIERCVGTASATGLPIALAGSISYWLMGLDESLPEGAIGYIYLPAFLGIIVTSILTAPIGAWLAHKLPQRVLVNVYAIFLLLTGVYVIGKQVI